MGFNSPTFDDPLRNAPLATAGQGLVVGLDGKIPASVLPSTSAASRGTSLPASPADGDEYVYVADATNGVLWRFKYNSGSASAYKWEYIGGPPMYSEVQTLESTSSTSYAALSTAGPSIVVARAGDYIVEIGAISTATDFAAKMSYDIGGTGAVDGDCVRGLAAGVTSRTSGTRMRLKTAIAAATTLTAKYKSDTSGTANFESRWMAVTPVRVA